MTLEKALKMVATEYNQDKKLDFVYNPLAYALYKVWKMADEKHPKPATDLTGKCGSCAFASTDDKECFVNSPCYIRCINPSRRFTSELAEYKQRTTKACKNYQLKENWNEKKDC